jgi:hypothetical protein
MSFAWLSFYSFYQSLYVMCASGKSQSYKPIYSTFHELFLLDFLNGTSVPIHRHTQGRAGGSNGGSKTDLLNWVLKKLGTDCQSKLFWSLSSHFNIYSYFLFWAVWGVELRALHLLSNCSTTWEMFPSLFCFLVIFSVGSHFYTQGTWTTILHFTLST